MGAQTMEEVINSIEAALTPYLADGQSLEDVAKIYKGGAAALQAEFPCIVLKPDTQERTYTFAAQRRHKSYIREFRVLIGCFANVDDIWMAFTQASAVLDEVLDILEIDTNIDAMGFDVMYDAPIDYGTVEFGGDQTFHYGASIPLLIKAKGIST